MSLVLSLVRFTLTWTHETYLDSNKSYVSLIYFCYNKDIRDKLTPNHNHTRTHIHMDTVHAQGRSTYDVHIEIDIDCEELIDACGLDYTRSEDDDTQNVIIISLDKEEAADVLDQSVLSMTNEQTIGTALLNHVI